MRLHASFQLSLLLLILLMQINFVPAANADVNATKTKYVVAVSALGTDVRVKFIEPSEIARQRETLSSKEFSRWQATHRWRRMVNRVSHLVMTDWAKQNNVSPTRKEIETLFSNQAKQHLQAFADTVEGKRRVALAVAMGTGSAVEWSTARALHAEYGGPVALSSFGGWIAVDGRNALLKEYAASGKIQFHDDELETLFWKGIEDPAVLDVTVSDPKRIENHFAKPPWLGWGIRTALAWKKQRSDDIEASVGLPEKCEANETLPSESGR